METAKTDLLHFWDQLLPQQAAEQVWVRYATEKGFSAHSYKDIHAQVHCTAAFLMQKGLQKGDHVLLISGRSQEYYILELALQFLGAVQIARPADISRAEVSALVSSFKVRFIYIRSGAAFAAHGEFADLQPQLTGIILGSDEGGDFNPEKLVTFDRVVTLGKAAWRENTDALNSMKAAVISSNPYALGSADGQSDLAFGAFVTACARQHDWLRTNQAQAVLNLLPPHRLHFRVHALAAHLNHSLLYCAAPEQLSAQMLRETTPALLVLSAAALDQLYRQLPAWLGNAEKTQKAFEKAAAVVATRESAESQGKKNPFFNRLKYNTGNKKLYARVRKLLGGQLQAVAIDTDGKPSKEVLEFFRECGIEVRMGS